MHMVAILALHGVPLSARTLGRKFHETGINSLAEAVENLERRGVRVMLCEANPRVLHKLVRAGLVRRGLKPARYFRNLGLALNSCSQTHPPTIAPASSTGAEKNAE